MQLENDSEKTCYLCGNHDFLKLEGQVRDNSELAVLKCKNCSLVFLSSFDHICNDFYENDGMHGDTNLQAENWRAITKEDDNRRYNFLRKIALGKKVLDFGCGNGGFLTRIKKVSQTAVGIELQASLQSYFAKCGLKVYQSIDEVCDKFDFITMFHVLEHIKNPIEMLQDLKPKLELGGEIIIEVPNSEDALISVYKNKAFMDFTYWACHLFLFNDETISQVAQKAGFRINYILPVQRYGVANHLYWQVVKKPGGHKKLWFLNIPFVDKMYEKALSSLNATDTIIASISPID